MNDFADQSPATPRPSAADLIRRGESLMVEFKSDRKCLPDQELVCAAVALANSDGGVVLVGVEDDGTVTGLHAKHRDFEAAGRLVANRTVPQLPVSAWTEPVDGKTVGMLAVPHSPNLVATSDGMMLRRRLKMDGSPESVPLYPHEIVQRQSSLGRLDPSAMPLPDVSVADMDPIQRIRIRQAIQKYGGDKSLLPLSDDELDGALGFVRTVAGVRRPTLAGLLFLGTPVLLRDNVPAYEVAFQVLRGTDVRVNEFYRKPLIETFEEVETQFKAWVVEEEMQIGLFRMAIPNYDRRAFREAFVNALVHRDFARLGAVHVRIDDAGLSITNPGGFVEGVRLDNLLVADPRSRNPLLADAIKRIGLAERTGRGIDRIFEGVLRYGRPAPNFLESTEDRVKVVIANAKPDFGFVRLIAENDDKLGPFPTDSLIILSLLRERPNATLADISSAVQKDESAVRSEVESLVGKGLVEAVGTGHTRSYILSRDLYVREGGKAAYTRQKGFSAIQHEQMILNYIDQHGRITRGEAMELCHLTKQQAYKTLLRMCAAAIQKTGRTRQAFYTRKKTETSEAQRGAMGSNEEQ